MSKLVIEDQRGRRTNVPLNKATVTVGRQEGATIRLGERNVSRRHLELRRERGVLYVIDVSRYGSLLNDKRFSGRAQVYNGDVLRVGDYTLHVELDDEAPNPRPEVPEAWIDHGTARLVHLERGVVSKTWRIRGAVTIGSGEEVDIAIDSKRLLAEHCTLTPTPDGWEIGVCDPASTLQVNGKSLQRRRLQRGDRIQLGGNIYRWTPENALSVSANPITVGRVVQRPKWHNWEAVGLFADKL